MNKSFSIAISTNQPAAASIEFYIPAPQISLSYDFSAHLSILVS
jgi:hypothetical protein